MNVDDAWQDWMRECRRQMREQQDQFARDIVANSVCSEAAMAAPLPAVKADPKSTLNKRFKDGPFKGLLFQEVSRDTATTPSTITLKFYGGRVFTVRWSEYNSWKEETLPET